MYIHCPYTAHMYTAFTLHVYILPHTHTHAHARTHTHTHTHTRMHTPTHTHTHTHTHTYTQRCVHCLTVSVSRCVVTGQLVGSELNGVPFIEVDVRSSRAGLGDDALAPGHPLLDLPCARDVVRVHVRVHCKQTGHWSDSQSHRAAPTPAFAQTSQFSHSICSRTNQLV